jgi:hypothetical protein
MDAAQNNQKKLPDSRIGPFIRSGRRLRHAHPAPRTPAHRLKTAIAIPRPPREKKGTKRTHTRRPAEHPSTRNTVRDLSGLACHHDSSATPRRALAATPIPPPTHRSTTIPPRFAGMRRDATVMG